MQEVQSVHKSKLSPVKAFHFIWPYIKPNVGLYTLGTVCLVATSALVMSFPLLTGRMIDIAIGKPDPIFSSITEVSMALGVVLLLQAVISFVRVYAFAVVSERAVSLIRTQLFEKYMHLSMSFFDRNRMGDLLSRLSSDVSQIQDVMSFTVAEFVRQVTVLVMGVILLLLISVQLTVFMLSVFPVVVLVAVFFGKSIKKLSKETQARLAEANVMAEELLQSMASVKIYVQEKFRIKKYAEASQKVLQFAVHTAKKRGLFISFIIFALFGSIVVVLWYGATMVQSGTMSIGSLTSFIMYTGFIGAAGGGIGELFTQIQKMMGAAERIQEIISEPEVEQSFDKSELKFEKGEIVFEHLYFRYPTRPEVEVLHDIHFCILPGEKIALVGASGAGKSTLVQLLMGFYTPTFGKIYIDRQPLETIRVQDLRRHMAFVPQEILLLGGTIRDNIAFANPNADETALIDAAKKAGAWEFINDLPEGLDTMVGDRGIRLSGGQRQRIALARAFLKNAPILILDEATSALDTASERIIQHSLEQLMQGRTVLTIAHRLSTIRNADKIIVLSNGKIVEMGTHDALMTNPDGIYARMVALQQKPHADLLTTFI